VFEATPRMLEIHTGMMASAILSGYLKTPMYRRRQFSADKKPEAEAN